MKLELRTILVLISILLVTTVGSAFVTSWFFTERTQSQAPPLIIADTAGQLGSAIPFDPELVWDAGTYTVNLAHAPGTLQRFVKVGISLQVDSSKTIAELSRRGVQVKDRIITILRTTSADQLADEEGISQLKERIVESVSELIMTSGGRVHHIYLTELVIQ